MKLPFKVVVDSMHGAGGTLIAELLSGGRCHVATLHPDPRPDFGGLTPEPIARHLEPLMREVRRTRSHVGIANDGDADRIGVVSPEGAFISPGKLLCVLLKYFVTERGYRGGVVTTISNTFLINRLAAKLRLPIHETPVGFKHIAKLMREQPIIIGGEESGGIGVQGYLPERDGILMGLLVLEAMAVQGEGIQQIVRRLERRYGRWWYGRKDLKVSMEQVHRFFERVGARPPASMAGIEVAEVKTLDGIKLIGRDESWLLFRRSGTEPIVRVYAESPVSARVARLLDFGVKLIHASS
jgi:phosphomannomutase